MGNWSPGCLRHGGASSPLHPAPIPAGSRQATGSKGQTLRWGSGLSATEGSRQLMAKAINVSAAPAGQRKAAHVRRCRDESSRALTWPICTAASKLTPQVLHVALSAGTRRPSAWVCRACSRGWRGDYQLLRKLHGAGRGPDPLSLRQQPHHWLPARLGGQVGLTQQLDGA